MRVLAEGDPDSPRLRLILAPGGLEIATAEALSVRRIARRSGARQIDSVDIDSSLTFVRGASNHLLNAPAILDDCGVTARVPDVINRTQ